MTPKPPGDSTPERAALVPVPTRAELHAFAVGALDPGREADVGEAVARDAAVHAELVALRAELGQDPVVPGWRLPPPGGPALSASAGEVLGAGPAPGDRAELRVVGDPGAFPVVLARASGPWEVVFPREPEDLVPLAAFPERDGARILEVSLLGETGEQRFAVVLLDRVDAVDRASVGDRWKAVQEGVLRGLFPTATVRFVVRASW